MSNYNIQNTGDMDHLSQFKTEGKAFLNFVRKPFDALHLRSKDALNAVLDHWNDPLALTSKCAYGVYDIAKNGLFNHPDINNNENEKFVKYGEMKSISNAYIRYVSKMDKGDNSFNNWLKESAMVSEMVLSQIAIRPLESLKKFALVGTFAMLGTAVIHNMPGADIVGLNPSPDLSCIAQSVDKNLESGSTLKSVLTSGAAGTALSIVPDVYKSCVNQDGFHASFGQIVEIMDKTESALSSPVGAGKMINEAFNTVRIENKNIDYGQLSMTDSIKDNLKEILDAKISISENIHIESTIGPEKPIPIEINFSRLDAILPTRQEEVENERDHAIEMTV